MIDIVLLKKSFPLLLRGSLVSLQLASFGTLIGISIGTLLGLALSGKNTLLKFLISAYVTIIRGTPMLIQIFIVAYVFPEIGINLSRFWAATVAIGLNSSAYVSQIVRSGISSVGKGQIEAARVLGFSSIQTLYYIILPQAFRVILPALGNELITLVKDSSLASVIGVVELTKEGSILRSTTLDAITIFTAVALIYLCITSLLSLLVYFLETKMSSYVKN
jgi:arginine/lysine/histidine transport system permease protein